jgi:hypothetical protein
MLHTFYEWNVTECNIDFQGMFGGPGLMIHCQTDLYARNWIVIITA